MSESGPRRVIQETLKIVPTAAIFDMWNEQGNFLACKQAQLVSRYAQLGLTDNGRAIKGLFRNKIVLTYIANINKIFRKICMLQSFSFLKLIIRIFVNGNLQVLRPGIHLLLKFL